MGPRRQKLAYVHFEEEPERRSAAKLAQLTRKVDSRGVCFQCNAEVNSRMVFTGSVEIDLSCDMGRSLNHLCLKPPLRLPVC
jgi:hypothetical protein